MQGFLVLVILAVGIYSVATQVLKGTDPKEFFRVKYIGPLSSSNNSKSPLITVQTKNQIYTPKKTEIASEPKVVAPEGFTVEQLSPYYKKVYLTSLSRARSANNSSSFILKPYSGIKENINITSWYLKMNSGATTKIPGAINNYNPFGTFTESDIVLSNKNQQVSVVSQKPGQFGKNLRINKCTGYLNGVYGFSPALPNQCPRVDRGDIVNFTGACQSFILSLRACQIPSSSDINFYASNDNACRDVLNTLNYGSCYSRHSNEMDFLGHEWRVWLGEKIPFDAQHDRVLLFDKQGLLVNEYIY